MDEKTLKEILQSRVKADNKKCDILYKVLKRIYNESSEYHGRFSRLWVIELIHKQGVKDQIESKAFFQMMVDTKVLSSSGIEFRLEDKMHEYIEAVFQPKSHLEKYDEIIKPLARFLAKRLIRGASDKQMPHVIKDMRNTILDDCKAFEKKTNRTLEQLVAQMYTDHFILKVGQKSYWRTLLGKRLTG